MLFYPSGRCKAMQTDRANVDDVSRAFGMIARDTSTYYVIGYQPENATMDGLFAQLAELTGVPAPRRHIPYPMARALGFAMWGWAELTGREPQLTHQVVDVFREHWAYSSRKAEAELGYQSRPLREGLRITIDWLRERDLIPKTVRTTETRRHGDDTEES